MLVDFIDFHSRVEDIGTVYRASKMVQINKALLPIKAHYFFFMAGKFCVCFQKKFKFKSFNSAMGPILPQINVFGKQLGISPGIMGFVMSVLPLMYILAKPAVGFLIDYFTVRWFFFRLRCNLKMFKFSAEYSESNFHDNSIDNHPVLCWILFYTSVAGASSAIAAVLQFLYGLGGCMSKFGRGKYGMVIFLGETFSHTFIAMRFWPMIHLDDGFLTVDYLAE